MWSVDDGSRDYTVTRTRVSFVLMFQASSVFLDSQGMIRVADFSIGKRYNFLLFCIIALNLLNVLCRMKNVVHVLFFAAYILYLWIYFKMSFYLSF